MIGVCFGLGLVVTLYSSSRNSRLREARDLLYLAEKTKEKELEKWKAQEHPGLKNKKLNLEAHFSESIQKFKHLDRNYAGLLPAFEAGVQLSHLYSDFGDFDQALIWYKKAVQVAPDLLEKALALAGLGYTYENLGKPTEAIENYQKANQLENRVGDHFKVDLLFAMARCYERLKNTDQARSIYDQIISLFPQTEHATLAELFKNQLQ